MSRYYTIYFTLFLVLIYWLFCENFDTLIYILNVGHSTSSGAKSDQTDEFWSDSNWRMFVCLSRWLCQNSRFFYQAVWPWRWNKGPARSFPRLTFLDVLGILEVKMAYFEEDSFWGFVGDVFSFQKRPFGTKSELIWLVKRLIFWELRILVQIGNLLFSVLSFNYVS